ncbi:Round spermatid basic protein 1 [Echinococcus granulosus]|uniref:Round spermatid basic protein 1 n=1 Tax=Echinococcus granulosus TaxID=6210 RepID=A0A068WJU9_ECHGR|nr:Round spermatid basic protein 1 [Echinococcus granulosus]CDS20053.1 Round spermatid basic protein 1 [Echinococcus granulosus]
MEGSAGILSLTGFFACTGAMCFPNDGVSCKHDAMNSSKVENGDKSHNYVQHILRASRKPAVLSFPRRHLSDLLYVEHYENGGGYILHAYAHEISRLSKEEVQLLVKKFFRSLFMERQKKCIPVPFSYFCIGIVHGAAKHIPELVNHIAKNHPSLIVSTSPLDNKNAAYTTTAKEFAENVFRTYCNGIYRYGPMHAISLVGVKGEERGEFCSDILEMIERDPFLKLVLPWGRLSSLSSMDPQKSSDGPILWVRPGEQALPLHGAPKSRSKKAANFSLGTFTSSRLSNPRQLLVQDRTPCHADHADDGLQRHTTAAIGLLKAVHPPNASDLPKQQEVAKISESTTENLYKFGSISGRIIKDVVVFDPRHYWDLVERLGLDIMEPPVSQCGNFWAGDGELNLLRTEGFRYARVSLRDNDIYFLPRGVIHQFKTVSAGTSIAWHTRLKTYYPLSVGTPSEGDNDSASNPTEQTTFLQTSPSIITATKEAALRSAKAQARALKRSIPGTANPQPISKKFGKTSSDGAAEGLEKSPFLLSLSPCTYVIYSHHSCIIHHMLYNISTCACFMLLHSPFV